MPVKLLDVHQRPLQLAHQAFLHGKVKIDTSEDGCTVYVPVKGKQGTYGLLEIGFFENRDSIQTELDMIVSLAEALGKSVERVRLYHQLQGLLKEQQLINEAAQQLHGQLDVQHSIQYTVAKIKEIFAPQSVHFLLYITGERAYQVVASSSPSALDKRFNRHDCPILDAVHKAQEP
ncbi:hypothetical protein GCM10010965_00270 [Caldalkalibacillus thermarum]|uniref:hypothetical protein n=1 Tax=Caldalkalibacillus thermarum TaxID=296745 RepID=UPI00166D4D7B|nr:hypothetical protein [Caldalkalibacillus thermarum]GGK11349.1 hypothetical protein GCM10010965_00270 [Caldalkalibacillus thermarum]